MDLSGRILFFIKFITFGQSLEFELITYRWIGPESVNKRKCYFGLISRQNELLCSLPVSILFFEKQPKWIEKKCFVGQKNWSKEILALKSKKKKMFRNE